MPGGGESEMSAGDTIQCHDLDELLKVHEELCADGWDVEFDYEQGKMAVLVLKGKEDGAGI